MAENDKYTINVDASSSIKSLGDLKKAIKEAKSAMIEAEEGSEEYSRALAECARYQHQMSEMTNQVRLATNDFGQQLSNISTLAGTVTAAIAGVNGALNLMGIEGDVAVDAIKKMQSILAISSAFSSLDQGIKAFKGLTGAIQSTSLVAKLFATDVTTMTTAQKANTVATQTATKAVNGFGMAMKAIGIGVLIAGLVAIVSNWDKITKAIKNATSAQQKFFNGNKNNYADINKDLKKYSLQLERLNQINSLAAKQREREIDIMKAQGATEEQINAYRLKSYEKQKQEIQAVLDKQTSMLESLQQYKDTTFYGRMVKDLTSVQNAQDNILMVQEQRIQLEERMANLDEKSKKAYEKRGEQLDAIESASKLYLSTLNDVEVTADSLRDIDKDIYVLTHQTKDTLEECSAVLEDNETLFKKRMDLQNELADYSKDEYQLLEQQYQIDQFLLSGDTKSLEILKEKYNYEKSLLDVKRMQSEIDKINAGTTKEENALDVAGLDFENASELLSGQWMVNAYDIESQILQKRIQQLTELRNTAVEGSEAQKMAQEELDMAQETYLANQKRRAAAEKKLQQSKVSAAVQMAGSVTSILDSLAESQDANTREGFERQKSFQVASATISMLAGITTAISGLFTTKSGPWDIALAAAQAAAIAVAGGVQIAKIKQQTYNSAGSGAASVPQLSVGALNAMTSVPEQITATGNSAEMQLKDNKVYVLESDITRTVKNVQVAEAESTF